MPAPVPAWPAWTPEPKGLGAWVSWETTAGPRVGQVWAMSHHPGIVYVVPQQQRPGEQSVFRIPQGTCTPLGFVEPPETQDAQEPEDAERTELFAVPAPTIEHTPGCVPGVTSYGCRGECVPSAERARSRAEEARGVYLAAYLWARRSAPDVTPAKASQWARFVAGGSPEQLAAARAMRLGGDAGSRWIAEHRAQSPA